MPTALRVHLPLIGVLAAFLLPLSIGVVYNLPELQSLVWGIALGAGLFADAKSREFNPSAWVYSTTVTQRGALGTTRSRPHQGLTSTARGIVWFPVLFWVNAPLSVTNPLTIVCLTTIVAFEISHFRFYRAVPVLAAA